MYLTLEVVSPQAASLGAQRRRVVGTNGLTIGRIAGNDWVIPDPYVSKQHARISFVNGGFIVEGLGRNPIAIAKPENAIPVNKPYALKNGDHVFIDQYDILVGIFQGDPPGSARPSDDPFGIVDAEADPGAVARPEPLIPGVFEDEESGDPAGVSSQLDPLMVLRGEERPVIPEATPVNLQPDSPLREPFTPPPVRVMPPPASNSGGIPEEWDQPANVSGARAAAGIPSDWDRSVSPRPLPPPPARPEIGRAPLQGQVQPQPQRSRPESRVQPKPRRGPLPQVPPRPEPSRVASGSRTDALPQPVASALPAAPIAARPPPAAQTAATVAVASNLVELLRAAGLSERDFSPEMMRELGQVLRIVVQGVMEVLQARADIKSQFRLPLTRVQATENNPLKLSPNVESALHTLLVQRNPGYLATVPAFEEAFADIRTHQMALLEGVRVAFASMLEAFDPEELRKEFDAKVKHAGPLAGVLGGAKSKYWDLYVERFTALQREPDDTFRRLFGDEFAQAYERQLERLKSLASQRNKN